MKRIKKLASLILALAMALTLAVPVLAADDTTYTLTLNNAQPGHTYTAYQIFAGDLFVETKDGKVVSTLSNITWGSGVTEAAQTEFGDAAAKAETIKTEADAKAFAETVADYLGTAAGSATIAAGAESGVITGLTAGYYLIKTTATTAENGVYTSYILKVVKDTEANIKADVPDVEKKVKENVKNVDFDAKYGAGYNDVADYNIGDIVPFAFYSNVPNMTDYTTYEYIFHDSMSAGLTLFENSIVVTVGGTTLAKGTDYTVTLNPEHQHDGKACTFQIRIENLKGIDAAETGADIKVTFNAVLNGSAEIGLPGNPNEVMLEYSNNPYDGGKGKTEWDKVIVFTYELDVNKVDGDNNNTKLSGAEFVLLNSDQTKVALVDSNSKLTGWDNVPADGKTWPTNAVLTSGTDGLFKVIGLDDGTYYLKETKAPAGYNLLADPIEVLVTATTANGQNWNDFDATNALTALTIKVGDETKNGDVTSGIVTTTVENNSGATLPETGGMGTTLFYALGAVLVIGAGVALVTKKRMA